MAIRRHPAADCGEELFLLTEVRWPAAAAPAPASIPGVPYLMLGALRGTTVRRSENGVVFVEDARREDGRWIVPGVVPIFTSRGGRLLDFGTAGHSIAGFLVPLPRYPWQAQRTWSAWLPVARPGAPTLPDQYSYRYKVILKSEPLRTQTIGPFEIDTISDYFYDVAESSRRAAHSSFRVRYKGQPVAGLATADTIAVVGQTTPALLVTDDGGEGTPCALAVDDGAAVRVTRIKGCGTPVTERLLTSDQARFTAAKGQARVPGWLDRESFAEPGLFQLDAAILDTRRLTATSFRFPEDTRPNSGVPALGLSPDEQSFVWLVQGPDETPRLGVTNWLTSETAILPIDPSRMRYNTESSFGPAWVEHHFQWTRGAAGDDVLVERPHFVPLPHFGDLTLGKPGEYQSYTLRPAGEPLRAAVVDLLVRELAGERLPDEAGAFHQRVRVNGKIVNVSMSDSPAYVNVSMDDGDPQMMTAIGARLDAAMASGHYDTLFVAPAKSPQ